MQSFTPSNFPSLLISFTYTPGEPPTFSNPGCGDEYEIIKIECENMVGDTIELDENLSLFLIEEFYLTWIEELEKIMENSDDNF